MKIQSIRVLLTLVFALTTVGVIRAKPRPVKLFKHIVMITFKEGAPASEIKEVDDSFQNLANKLSVVKGYEWGKPRRNGQVKQLPTSINSASRLTKIWLPMAHHLSIRNT